MEQTSIGVVGTAKNTGKTTTVLGLLDACLSETLGAGLVGIGYDGEELDHITGLPKPNYFLMPPISVATAEECLLSSQIPHEILVRTGISSVFGEILIARVKAPGRVILAGPNKAEGISFVLEAFKKIGTDIVLIDGSINRVIPLMEADQVVFATGASRSTDIHKLAKEIEAIHFLFCLGRFIPKDLGLSSEKEIKIVSWNGKERFVSGNSICSKESLERVMGQVEASSEFILIPGIIFFEQWKDALSRFEKMLRGKQIILPSPGHILVSGEPVSLMGIIQCLSKGGSRISVLKSISMAAVTVNPSYPEKKDFTGGYTHEYIDEKNLLHAISKAFPGPVFNMKHPDSGRRLLRVLKKIK